MLSRKLRILLVVFSLALHALALVLFGQISVGFNRQAAPRPPDQSVIILQILSPDAENAPPPAAVARVANLPEPMPEPRARPLATAISDTPQAIPPAIGEAPSAPSAEDWSLAAKYTLKNSKRYRYSWGQQVRSMMGVALAGPDQGAVRLRVEIAPDGSLAKLETLWSTSASAERLAHKAIKNMPPLPPTPTGKPLMFEKTISFQPYDVDEPPIYKYDCLPDPPTFNNPFAWNGTAAQTRAEAAPAEKLDPQAMEECLKQLPVDSIEAESTHDKRQQKQWGSSALGR